MANAKGILGQFKKAPKPSSKPKMLPPHRKTLIAPVTLAHVRKNRNSGNHY